MSGIGVREPVPTGIYVRSWVPGGERERENADRSVKQGIISERERKIDKIQR